MKEKLIVILLCFCLILCGCGGYGGGEAQNTDPPAPAADTADPPAAVEGGSIGFADITGNIAERDGYYLNAAVLYCGSAGQTAWETTVDYLAQALVLNLSVTAVDASAAFELRGFDILYVDESAAECGGDVFSAIIDFTKEGGFVFLPNRFCTLLPAEYLGISGSDPLEGYPEGLAFPAVPEDLKTLQSLIADFYSLYPSFSDARIMREMDYGFGLRTTTALPLATYGESALYSLNGYGDGAVLLASPLLPNSFSKCAFSLAASEGQTSFSNTTASCNQLFLSEFAAYAAKEIYGFSLHRVFGAYGSPAMSWELHYEDITSIAHDSIGQFAPICRENRQIPSIALIRNTYTWFEQAETLAYSLNTGAGADLSFALDRDESVYSSGTHIAVEGQWLQLNALQNCISYFEDSAEENYRLYPCVLDYDGDGIEDAFCGSADGMVYFFKGLGFTGTDGRFCMEKPVLLEGVSVAGFSAPALTDLDGDGFLDLLVGASDGCVYSFPGDGSLRFGAGSLLLNAETTGQCLPSAGDLNRDGVEDLAIGSNTGILDLYFGRKDGERTVYSHHSMADLTRKCAELKLGK